MTRALRIVIVYAISGIVWISVSDVIFFIIEGAKAFPVAFMGSCSALIFLLLTSFILFKLINLHYNRLQNSEKQYRSYFVDNPTPMWIYELKTLKFITVNNATIANYGYTKDEFFNMNVLDIHPSDDEERILEMLKNFETIYKNSGVWQHFTKSGKVIYAQITSHLILSGKEKKVMMMANDISKRIEDEQQLKNLNIGLVKQNALLTEIAWSQSHDIRRPLASILGLTHLMHISDNDLDRQHCVELIEKSAEDLDLMIKNISEQIDLAMFKN